MPSDARIALVGEFMRAMPELVSKIAEIINEKEKKPEVEEELVVERIRYVKVKKKSE